jgi:hypothetical protein
VPLALSFLIVLRLTWSKQAWKRCGLPDHGCFCSVPTLSQVQCVNIDTFPIFDDNLKSGVLSMTILKSNITELTSFNKTEWNSLKHLNLIDTVLLPCSRIAIIKRPGLRILSECLCSCEKDECKHTTCTIWLASIIVLTCSFTLSISFIIYLMNCYERKQRRYTLSENRSTDHA